MGIPRRRFKKMTGQDLDTVIDPDFLATCIESNFLIADDNNNDDDGNNILKYIPKHLEHERKEGGIRPTEEGLARMDSILPNLLRIHELD